MAQRKVREQSCTVDKLFTQGKKNKKNEIKLN